MKSSRQQKQNSFHFVFENVSYVALCAHSSDCFKVQNNTLCETNDVLLLQWHVRLLQEESTIMMHALILHTPTYSNISSVSLSLFSLTVSASLSLPLSSSFCSFCLRVCVSLSLLHAESAEVSTEMQSQLYFSSPTHGEYDSLRHLSNQEENRK